MEACTLYKGNINVKCKVIVMINYITDRKRRHPYYFFSFQTKLLVDLAELEFLKSLWGLGTEEE